MTAFFTQSIVDAFQTQVKDEFRSTFAAFSAANIVPWESHPWKKLSEKTMKSNFTKMIKASCKGSIGPIYTLNLIKRLLSTNSGEGLSSKMFDIAFIYNGESYKTNPTEIPIDFIIAEKGECHDYPNVYTINLICSASGKGKFLMALYLYTIIVNPDIDINSKFGLLELANGYINFAGFCMYSKFGFEYKPYLFSETCFNDIKNMPMIVDLSGKSPADIFDILKSSERAPFELCSAIGFSAKRQFIFAMLLNLRRFVTHDTVIEDHFIVNGDEHKYTKLYKMCVGKLPPDSLTTEYIDDSVVAKIDEALYKIKTKDITSDAQIEDIFQKVVDIYIAPVETLPTKRSRRSVADAFIAAASEYKSTSKHNNKRVRDESSAKDTPTFYLTTDKPTPTRVHSRVHSSKVYAKSRRPTAHSKGSTTTRRRLPTKKRKPNTNY